jgi:hypothetical protein
MHGALSRGGSLVYDRRAFLSGSMILVGALLPFGSLVA